MSALNGLTFGRSITAMGVGTMAVMRGCWPRRLALVAVLVVGSTGCGGLGQTATGVATPNVPASPPAVSGVDDTVWMHIELADSFDALPDGTCAGRDTYRGMSDQARVYLRGNETGFSDQTSVSARFKQYPTVMYHGEPRLDDDYKYCVIDAVFTPSMPDPSGYWLKFAGVGDEVQFGPPGRTPFGQPEHLGYGKYQVVMQACRSRLDPPGKVCPEWEN
jgi:hypothetical protein